MARTMIQTAGRTPARADGGADGRRVRQAVGALPEETMINALAETFRALSDPTRIRLIAALSGRELCVRDLAQVVRLTGSAVSHQLRLLRAQRLVRYRKQGKTAFYSLDDEHISRLVAEGIRHVQAG